MHERPDGEHPRFGPFEMDVRERELKRDGVRVRLQGKPFEFLAALVERPGELVTRDELRRRLWTDDTFVAFDENLNAAVRKTRDALGDSAVAPRYIETVPRHGYRFIGAVQSRPATPPQSEAASPIAATSLYRHRRLAGAAWAAAAVSVAGLCTTVWLISAERRTSPPDLVRVQVRPPDDIQFPAGAPRAALSPDGRQVAFLGVSQSQGRSVWVHALDESVPRRIAGTEHAWDPFWSPDGRELAFVASGTLHRVSLNGGVTTRLGDADGSAGAWSRESGILVPRRSAAGLMRLLPDGRQWELATVVDRSRGETRHLWPQFLPDGRSFIYLALCEPSGNSAIYLARVGQPGRTRVLLTPFRAAYAAPGVLLFVRNNALVAQRMDATTGTLSGDLHEIVRNVPMLSVNGAVGFSVSSGANGVLAYAAASRPPQRQLVWMNRAGQQIGRVGTPQPITALALSRDERFVVIESADPGTLAPDLWSVDLAGATRTRLTDNPANDESPAFGPGRHQFTYARHRAIHQIADVYTLSMTGAEPPRPMLAGDGSKHPSHWSADGRYLLYEVEGAFGKRDVWLASRDGGSSIPWLATEFDERRARFSPDGRWVAYESDRSGRTEVYVRGFKPPHATRQVTTAGGTQPEWRSHGPSTELFYMGADFRVTAVRVLEDPALRFAPPQALFEIRRLAAEPKSPTPYAVSADGQRVLVALVTDEGSDSPIQVLLKWTALLLRGRTPTP